MTDVRPAPARRPWAAAALSAALLCSSPGLQASGPLRAAALQPWRGVDIHYDLASTREPGGRLGGVLRDGRGEWRTDLRVDPLADGQPLTRLDTRWRHRPVGTDTTVVIGDTEAGGLGSAPLRLGGIRIGGERPVRLAPATPGLSLEPAAALDALRLAADAVASGAATRAGYDLEAGWLRSGWGTLDDRYGDAYGAAAWRGVAAEGLAAQARSEWTPLHAAAGLELSGRLDAATALRAVVGHAGGEQAAGMQWGLGVVRSEDGAAWTLGWDQSERGYTPRLEADSPARGRLHGAASLELPGGRAGVSYTRQLTWNAGAAEVYGLAGTLALADQRKLTLSYALRLGDQAQAAQKIGLTLSVPLSPRIGP